MTNNGNTEELEALRNFNEGVKIAREVYNQGTNDLLSRMQKMEENNINWAEIERSKIDQIGMENYLINQTGSQRK